MSAGGRRSRTGRRVSACRRTVPSGEPPRNRYNPRSAVRKAGLEMPKKATTEKPMSVGELRLTALRIPAAMPSTMAIASTGGHQQDGGPDALEHEGQDPHAIALD